MTRRDNKGRVLQKGETYQEKFDRYRYTYTDVLGKRHSVFSDTLKELRVREEETCIEAKVFRHVQPIHPYSPRESCDVIYQV